MSDAAHAATQTGTDAPERAPGTATGVEERTRPAATDDGDQERLAHIVWAPGGNAEAAVLRARVTGTPVTALCGKRWVPARDPQRYPLCGTCAEIRQRRREAAGG